ncbi:AraC family transcriptional regulator [Micromonospora zingiberis]|uniref:AraC family transcriptional regulator n=1 Tax=Micromonospora zingiberis TaxID=2053011 RepID=UPI0013F49187|nr:helix-turn-helix transcriptional regulator [Micromonospora zingiberis]
MKTQGPTAHRFDSQNPDTIQQFLTNAYGTQMTIRAARAYRLRHDRIDAGPFCLDTMAQSSQLDIDVGPIDALVVSHVVSGRIDRDCAGTRGRFGPGDVFLAAMPGLPYSIRWRPGKITSCLLDLSVLTKVASGTSPKRIDAVRFTGLAPVSSALARLWRHTTSYLDRVVLANPHAYRQPLVIANAARMLAASALAVFPNTAAAGPTAADRRDATTATLRRATDFIEEYADRDIVAADIAAAARVSLRALQMAFRRHLDTTPMAHLRQVRLDRVHRDLLRADPRQDTVSAIASRWGFVSHSRFTARYHAAYGILPSRTLHA